MRRDPAMRRPRSLAVAFFSVARQQRQLILAGFAAPAMTAQLIDFGTKRFNVLKAAVHRREAHIADLVQAPPLLHHHFPHAPRSDFPLSQAAQLVATSRPRGLDRASA